MNTMRIAISALLIILALHFILRGVTQKENKVKKEQKEEKKPAPEEFTSDPTESLQNELVDYVDCKIPKVKEGNYYASDENNANFESNVLNVNRFYRKGTPPDTPIPQKTQPTKPPANNQWALEPNTWRYENEMPMNGGEILPGLTGFDNLSDQYSSYSTLPTLNNNCTPPSRGATTNDDLRMGMGLLNAGRRERT